MRWHAKNWGSKFLVKVRTVTLGTRNRDEQDQRCIFCRGQGETIEHFLVECGMYEEQRSRLIESIITVVVVEEWNRWLEDDDGISTALELYGSKVGSGKIIENTKLFLEQACD